MAACKFPRPKITISRNFRKLRNHVLDPLGFGMFQMKSLLDHGQAEQIFPIYQVYLDLVEGKITLKLHYMFMAKLKSDTAFIM